MDDMERREKEMTEWRQGYIEKKKVNKPEFKRELAKVILSVDGWIKAGKPKMWTETEVHGNYYLDSDHAYGGMRITKIVDGKIVDQNFGKEFVVLDDYVALSEYCMFNKAKLFVAANKGGKSGQDS